jgi:hypothetical protein
MDKKAVKVGTTISREEFEILREYLSHKKIIISTIISGSMEPLIKIGGKISIAPITESFKKFDIIVFWNGRFLICHYIWHLNELMVPGSNGRNYITRGLRHRREDLPCASENILGKVTSHKLSKWARAKILLKGFY